MTVSSGQIVLEPFGKETKSIQQAGIPFNVPLGLPVFNPFAGKRMHFRTEYKVDCVSVEELIQGVLFADYREFMDIKKETYSRRNRTRYIHFNPFTKEFEKEGKRLGEAGAAAGRSMAAMMVAALGLIEWNLTQDPGMSQDEGSVDVKVTNKLFFGHFKIRARRQEDGVLFEDNWCPSGGGDMRTEYLAMANLVLTTHPKGFEQLAERVIEEITRARQKGIPYIGEIGSPSIEV